MEKTLNKNQIIEAISNGSKLRWLPGSMIGFNGGRCKERFLLLDGKVLSTKTHFSVSQLEHEGVLKSHEDPDVGVISYDLEQVASER